MLVTGEDDIKIANSLSTQALVFNGISTNAQANALVAGPMRWEHYSSAT